MASALASGRAASRSALTAARPAQSRFCGVVRRAAAQDSIPESAAKTMSGLECECVAVACFRSA